jgi:hypothetical protein
MTANSIRLRLSQTEVRKFSETGAVEETVTINRTLGQNLRYRLRRDDAINQMALSFENNCINVYVPASIADAWAATEQVGIEIKSTNDRPSILVEKDFACLHPRAGDEDVDSFPNPEAKSAY